LDAEATDFQLDKSDKIIDAYKCRINEQVMNTAMAEKACKVSSSIIHFEVLTEVKSSHGG
jgi:hypothetical protein